MGSKPSKTTTTSTEISQTKTSPQPVTVKDVIISLILDGAVLYGCYLTSKYLYNSMRPLLDDFIKSNNHRDKLQKRLTQSNRKIFVTSYFEELIAGDLIDPNDIDVGFNDIGGLEDQKQDLHDLIVLPLKAPHLFAKNTQLLSVPKGMLLYGQPGTGKTMLAKAIAKESGAFFINLKISTLMSKWFGESQKLVRAAFSLAHKLAPCIIFIDEVDAFMGTRGGSASDANYTAMKTEFLALWDGFQDTSEGVATNPNGFGVVVMGATNRPGDVDPAFLRRMPRTFEIQLPDLKQRAEILKILLLRNRHQSHPCVDADFDFEGLSLVLEGYSGSDLKELCRAAMLPPLREMMDRINSKARAYTKERTNSEEDIQSNLDNHQDYEDERIRFLTMEDFEIAKRKVKATGVSAHEYEASQQAKSTRNNSTGPMNPTIDNELLAAIFAAGLQQLTQYSPYIPQPPNMSRK